MKKKILAFALILLLLCACTFPAFTIENNQIKNIIFMIPDGGGISPFYLSDALKQAGGWNRDIYPYATKTPAEEMYIKQYMAGGVQTYCANKEITDSAAAGTALSTGYKTNYSYVGVNPQKMPIANLLEAAQYLGKRTGMVTTYEWTNATPAAFAAHSTYRGQYSEMAEQIVNQDIDVILGVGFNDGNRGSISSAIDRGYSIINNREELASVKSGDRIWGNFYTDSFPYDISNTKETPTLAEMTNAAINALKGSKEGFFLMVEGSAVDGGGHLNSAKRMVGEYLAFDEACRVSVEFAKTRKDTAVIIVPDHDTGGMILPPDMENAVKNLQEGINPDDIGWTSNQHTSQNVPLFVYVPEGTEYPGNVLQEQIGLPAAFEENVVDNTYVSKYAASLMGADLDEITKQLFVDVTDRGRFYPELELFCFSDCMVSVKANTSYAFIGNRATDLEGMLCLWFYVPQLLVDIIDGKTTGKEYTFGTPGLTAKLETYLWNEETQNYTDARITLTNLMPGKSLSGKIRFVSPKSIADTEEIKVYRIGYRNNFSKTFSFREPAAEDMGKPLKVEFVAKNGKVYEFSFEFSEIAYSKHTEDGVAIDGLAEDDVWQTSAKIKCNDLTNVVELDGWKGEHDLSATVSSAWNNKYFYLLATVTDDVFFNTKPNRTTDNGDCVQLGIFADKEDGERTDTAKMILSCPEGEPSVFVVHGDNSGEFISEDNRNYKLACYENEDRITYELKVKWSELFGDDYSPSAGDIIGFASAFHDDDGDGRRGHMECGKGLYGEENPELFLKLPLFDYSKGDNSRISIVYEGERVVTDVEPVVEDNMVFIPLRALVEEMGETVEWNGSEGVVSFVSEDAKLKINILNGEVTADGIKQDETVPVMIQSQRTLVHVRAIPEILGCSVEWNGETNCVVITKQE